MRFLYQQLAKLALETFGDILTSVDFIGGTFSDPNKIRLWLIEGSFLDIWLSDDGDYAYHWERRGQTGEIFRWDNAPHYPNTKTYLDHFHKGTEGTVVESYLGQFPEHNLKQVLEFVRKHLAEE
ncbi:MAG: hypothetical protein MAG431_01393 [Chloroflexi bacterium]|nr:hypothetical protein [Chloroflexota bacterium]